MVKVLDHSDVIICAVSNTDDPEDIERAIQCGANDFIKKPIYTDILAPKIADYIDLIKQI